MPLSNKSHNILKLHRYFIFVVVEVTAACNEYATTHLWNRRIFYRWLDNSVHVKAEFNGCVGGGYQASGRVNESVAHADGNGREASHHLHRRVGDCGVHSGHAYVDADG